MKRLVLASLFVLCASSAQAAYTQCVPGELPVPDGYGNWKVRLVCTSPVGAPKEPPTDFIFIVNATTTQTDVRVFVDERIDQLNAALTFATSGFFVVGNAIPPLDRAAIPMEVCKQRAKQVDRGDRINTASANAHAARLAVARTALDTALAALANQAQRDECLTQY